MRRALLVALALVLGACEVVPYCLVCPEGELDASTLDADATRPDARVRVDGCIATDESCNAMDDDCDGNVDEGDIPGTGGTCGTDVGECAVGRFVCEGGTIRCGAGAIAAMAESCNGLDDDCDGTVDDGDPGGGVPCGVETGDCRAGTTHCTAGALACEGAVGPSDEVCDGHDNDCDGTIDDGNPGGGAICLMGMDACTSGTERCQGGTLMCIVESTPHREVCDRIDNDCDGRTDEDFDLNSDVNHCGDCSVACVAASARSSCALGVCRIAGCDPGQIDLDGDYTNGCEYACELRGSEVCNGSDDDCDGRVDETLTPPDLCFHAGECAGTVATCTGAMGWRCNYPATVSLGPAGDVVPESNCDGRDDDCDGVPDDSFTLRGTACSRGVGACTTHGTLVCNATHDGLDCNAADPPAGTAEVCNGIDDDCNGALDDGAPDAWVTITGSFGTREIYRYEASRPDATGTLAGAMEHRSCSTAGRLPWTNVTYAEAEAACEAAGARLCTEAEWQRACQTAAPTACEWSYASSCTTYQPSTCNGNDYDSDTLRPGDQDALAATGAFASCYSDWGGSRVFDLSGNVTEWTAARAPGVNPLRGGSYDNPGPGMACDFAFAVASDTFLFPNVGFRCCR